MKSGLTRQLVNLAGIICLLEGASAFADVLPGPALPEQVGEALMRQAPQQPTRVLPPVEQQEEKTEVPLSDEAKQIKFKLNKIELEGNQTFPEKVLKVIYKNELGKEITIEELFKIVQSITNFYRNNGYIISRAILPPQQVKGGIVKVRIIEGFLDNVNVTGKPRGAQCVVQAYGDNIKKQKPLKISVMEEYLLLANEIPGTTVKAVLAPSEDKQGAADLNLVTEMKPASGYVTYDNYGTRYIGPLQISANFRANSTVASGDSISATMTKSTKGEQLTFNDVNYTLPFYDQGKRIQIGATRTHTRPGFVLKVVKVDGLTYNYYSTIQFPIIRTRSKNFTTRIGYNEVNTHTTALDLELYTDHVRSFDAGATYNFADSWYGTNTISGDFRQGLPIWNYSSNTNPQTALTSRPGGHAVYSKFAMQASRQQLIKGNLSLYGNVSGQYAFNSLLSSEQFAYGGSVLGRGYDPAELIGDKGLAASLEMRYNWNINQFNLNTLQLYAFYDAGAIWNILVNDTSPAKVSATSVGFGTRFFMTKYVSGNVMWAQPITKNVNALALTNNGRGNGKEPRVFFSVVASL